MEEVIVLPSPEEVPFKCRICLNTGSTLYSFNHFIVLQSGEEVLILDALCEVTSEPAENFQNANLPQSICESCLTQLEQAFIFRSLFATASVIWKEYLSKICETVKIEDVDIKNIKSLKAETENTNETDFFSSYIFSENENFEDSSSVQKTVKVKNVQPIAVKIHPCPFCTEQFPALALKKHIKTHKCINNYLNAPGLPKFKNKVRFYANPKEGLEPLIIRNEPTLHKCIYCGQRIPVAEFNDHIDQHLKEGNLSCDLCKRQFHDYRALRTHRVKHVKHYKYFCKQCDKGFLKENNYSYHLMAHNNVYMYNCEFCGKSFSNPQHCKRHIAASHSEGLPKPRTHPFKCRKCLCRFMSRSSLESHSCKPITIKRTTKKTLCHLCGKDVYFLSAHMARHRFEAKPKQDILCPHCGRNVSQNNWAMHMRTHTGEKKRYECDLCDKGFWRPQQLRDHRRVHTGEKPFACVYCGLAFSRLYNLQVHERIHKGVKPHVCKVCSKSFFEASYLKKHLKTHEDRPQARLAKPNTVKLKEEVKLQRKPMKRKYFQTEKKNVKQDINFEYLNIDDIYRTM